MSFDGSLGRLGESVSGRSIIDDDDYQEVDEYAANARPAKSLNFDPYYEGSLDLKPFRINFLQIEDDDEVYTNTAPKSNTKTKFVVIFAVILVAAGLGGTMLTSAKV